MNSKSHPLETSLTPFQLMLTVPLSMTGALLALLLSGGTLNVYSQIGLVTLLARKRQPAEGVAA